MEGVERKSFNVLGHLLCVLIFITSGLLLTINTMRFPGYGRSAGNLPKNAERFVEL